MSVSDRTVEGYLLSLNPLHLPTIDSNILLSQLELTVLLDIINYQLKRSRLSSAMNHIIELKKLINV